MPRLPTLFAHVVRQQQAFNQRIASAALGRSLQPTLFQPLKSSKTSFSTSSQQRAHQSSKQYQEQSQQQQDNYYYYQHVVTESSVLHSFPRPNLTPTLHFTLFTDVSTSASNDKPKAKKKQCKNCKGPHESDHCPC
ncbi:hypothetical protein DM01DRAFT_1338583 [Hesseltinella vesiculosa]|uniref:Uncharacterized protein n=1 Tax=Hesseltinella vesiculosa TaxID=101127 RepID=A0A1X2G9J2_9FUNG|nr:hypothetical protein DM01DRAFT_1338583 [Hesseltinella vesiculosa]